jgi:hypothetical protein
MAINTATIVIIAGAASATQATAVSNYNAAVATLYANAAGAIWNPLTIPPTPGPAGMINADTAATYTCWGQFMYLSAS